MRHAAVKRIGTGERESRLDALVLHVGRLLRHPAYRRERVISPLLLRYLPSDAGYAWRGEELFRARLIRAGLDGASLDHLVGNARAELARLRGPVDI